MAANSVVRARVEESDKAEASAVLAAMGLTFSDAFRLLVKRIAREKALPFEPLVPNAETIEAMKAARRADDGRRARRFDRQSECGLLNIPAVSGATTGGKNQACSGPCHYSFQENKSVVEFIECGLPTRGRPTVETLAAWHSLIQLATLLSC